MNVAETLRITLVQTDIVWEDKAANLEKYARLIREAEGPKEIVALPEMFSTGFSMAPERLAESMDGPTVSWMRELAREQKIILTGSLIIEEDGHYYNRLVWMQPNGECGTYDKRHLFGYAEENKHYESGERRLIVQVKGWKIFPLICYDLRFPVWARNQMVSSSEQVDALPSYDVLLYVANWPERRSLAWRTLLQARAIENQSYCVGVNRVGHDGKDISYVGDSSVFDPLGATLWHSNKEEVYTVTLSRKSLDETRAQLPFLTDADRFVIP
jgi:predicted amidohydrolase